MSKVCILDYGSGNVRSVSNLFSTLARETIVSNDPADIAAASHIVLPGVGAFAAAMRRIHERLPMAAVKQAVFTHKKPFLGICVGMQVLATRGLEFGEHQGLGWIPGQVRKIEAGGLPVPHIGWNNTNPCQSSPLFAGLENDPDFYFVHSYIFEPEEGAARLTTTDYGEKFCSAIKQDNIYGVQFHPEKSQRAGLRLVKNFLALP